MKKAYDITVITSFGLEQWTRIEGDGIDYITPSSCEDTEDDIEWALANDACIQGEWYSAPNGSIFPDAESQEEAEQILIKAYSRSHGRVKSEDVVVYFLPMQEAISDYVSASDLDAEDLSDEVARLTSYAEEIGGCTVLVLNC